MTEDRSRVLLAILGPMVVINLPQRADRRAAFAEQLSRIGLSFDHPGVRLFAAVRPDEPGGFPSIGARGCFLSHLGVLRKALAAGQETVLICEDDLDFAPDLPQRLAGIAAALRSEPWDIFYGGHGAPPPGRRVAEGLLRVEAGHGITCTHFYALRGPAIRDLVAYLEAILGRPAGHPDGGPMHVDGGISRFRKDHPQYVTLSTVPSLGVQRPSRTDIHALRWFDRWPVMRDVAGALRRVRTLRAKD